MGIETGAADGSGKPGIIYTVTAHCQDCYRCVRACPVKAIQVTGGQAFVKDSLCIKCGTCVRECPQGAKTIRGSLEKVRRLLAENPCVVASVAPSFPAVFTGWRAARLPAALRLLGFKHVAETAEGADKTTVESLARLPEGNICIACPAVVNYIEMYRPEYVNQLIPVVSPMVAHGRMLKKRYGESCAVVFVGPCAAKKSEALRLENADAIDEVITFAELLAWMEEEGLDLAACPESPFESAAFNAQARLFPLQGGMLKTGEVTCDGTQDDILHISGAEDVMELFSIAKNSWRFNMVEPLFCLGGCINGPAFPRQGNIYERRSAIISHVRSIHPEAMANAGESVSLTAVFYENSPRLPSEEINDSRIQEVLKNMGKSAPEDQLNCGACGYKTCLDNALAVARGLAEPEMCMPYMRRLAQQRSDRIIETSPNGVVVLDSELNIINMNPAFQRMFMCNNSILGRNISYLVNADGFEKLRDGAEDQCEAIRTKYGIKYHELLYSLRDEKQYVGMYTSIARHKPAQGQGELIKRQTLEQARELLDNQITFSQEMAHYLGKSLARNEELVQRLIGLFEEDEDAGGGKP